MKQKPFYHCGAVSLLLILCCFLSACGTKGDLVLADEKAPITESK